MGIRLVGGKHTDSVKEWKEKVPNKKYDIIGTEMISAYTPSLKILRLFYQPLSALVLFILNSKRFLIHNLLGINVRQNDNKLAKELAKENDAKLLNIDASVLRQIESFSFKNLKTFIDWFNLVVIYHIFASFNLSFLNILFIVMLTLSIHLVATLWMYKNTRDQFMADKILESYEENKEMVVLTGSLHTPAIAGYLFSKGIKDIEVIGVPEISE